MAPLFFAAQKKKKEELCTEEGQEDFYFLMKNFEHSEKFEKEKEGEDLIEIGKDENYTLIPKLTLKNQYFYYH